MDNFYILDIGSPWHVEYLGTAVHFGPLGSENLVSNSSRTFCNSQVFEKVSHIFSVLLIFLVGGRG